LVCDHREALLVSIDIDIDVDIDVDIDIDVYIYIYIYSFRPQSSRLCRLSDAKKV